MNRIKKFHPEHSFTGDENSAVYHVRFHKSNILLDAETGQLPLKEPTQHFLEKSFYLGKLNGLPVRAAWAEEPESKTYHSKDFVWTFDKIPAEEFEVVSFAYQILNWEKGTRYCGQCGDKFKYLEKERGKQCPSCGRLEYPRITPAVIMAVVKDNQLLLARAKNFIYNFYSVLAGYVEPGETLEECVAREVYEEVGIRVKNIRYFGSQSWARTSALMMGFIAEYESGEIKIDEEEIAEAGWFTVDKMPAIPGKVSISRDLIDWFIESQQIRD